MNQRAPALVLASGTLVLLSPVAHAQQVPWIVLPLAASPVVAVLLAVACGIARKSWLAGIGNTALVIVWVSWFVAASNYSTSDALAWAPIVGLGVHALAMAWLIASRAASRRKPAG